MRSKRFALATLSTSGENVPPFLQFRLWLKDSPSAERITAAIGLFVALMLVVVALVPVATRDDDSSALTTGSDGGRPGASASAGDDDGALTTPAGDNAPAGDGNAAIDGSSPLATGGPSSGSGATGRTGGATGSATGGAGQSAAGANACAGLGASAPGVTASEVFMAVSLISLAGPIGNSQFDIRPDLDEIVKALVAETNRTGGVACGRKLRVKTYDVNPLDANDAQTKCLQMVEAKPYVVLDFGGYLRQAARTCFVQNKLPVISTVAFDENEFKVSFPYVVSPRNYIEDQARNMVLGLADRGFFKAPAFKKVGLILENCLPSLSKTLDDNLRRAGVSASEVSKYVIDCNPAAAGNQIAQAVLQHKGDNATHVLLAMANNNAQNYSRIAASQQFSPVYGLGDVGEGVTPSGAKNWHPSFDGALGITSGHVGETFSGMRNSLVDRCDEIMKRNGVPGFTSEAKDAALLGLCDLFDFFRAAINKAGKNPVRTSFATGITQIGEFKTAGSGDGVFNRPDKYKGNDFQRAVRYEAACGCWKVKDAFGPAYTG